MPRSWRRWAFGQDGKMATYAALVLGLALVQSLFARVWLAADSAGQKGAERLFVPTSAVLQRAEMTAVYVVNAQGKPSLRQVRLGTAQGDQVEVLSGVSAGDKVVLEPARVGASR